MLLVAMKIVKIYQKKKKIGCKVEGKAQRLNESPKLMPQTSGKSTGCPAHCSFMQQHTASLFKVVNKVIHFYMLEGNVLGED